jgi:hypothetical protein
MKLQINFITAAPVHFFNTKTAGYTYKNEERFLL